MPKLRTLMLLNYDSHDESIIEVCLKSLQSFEFGTSEISWPSKPEAITLSKPEAIALTWQYEALEIPQHFILWS